MPIVLCFHADAPEACFPILLRFAFVSTTTHSRAREVNERFSLYVTCRETRSTSMLLCMGMQSLKGRLEPCDITIKDRYMLGQWNSGLQNLCSTVIPCLLRDSIPLVSPRHLIEDLQDSVLPSAVIVTRSDVQDGVENSCETPPQGACGRDDDVDSCNGK
jgi:hypothetical protein